MVKLLSKLPQARTVLMVLDAKQLNFQKSANNLPNIKILLVNYLNVVDLLKYDQVIFLEEALKKAEDLFCSN